MKGLGVTASTLLVLLAASAAAQSTIAPTPIPTPPIPDPPKFSPAHPVTLGRQTAPPAPVVNLPEAPVFDRIAVPPTAALTTADKSDPVPPPLGGVLTGPPPTVSPGASKSQIQEVAFIVDAASSQLSAAAEAKLRDVAQELKADPTARLEARVYSPSKLHSESAARRLSLARFLTVRDILRRNGIDDARIDGRPLTSEPNELNADRIELYIER